MSLATPSLKPASQPRRLSILGSTGSIGCSTLDLVERNRDEVEWLSIRTVEGEVWRFTSEGPLPFLPAHFRQHQVLGQTVKIFYITRGELLVAIHATD